MIKYVWKLMVLVVFASALILQGCTIESGDGDVVIVDDDGTPATPRGVYSITGDMDVLIGWYPNQESDLAGYVIYSKIEGSRDYTEIAEINDSDAIGYLDEDVENGTTYYYAVSAFDLDGNESIQSPAIADTPRPAGRNVTLEDYILEPDLSGFDLSRPDKGVQPFDARNVDIYFGVGVVSVGGDDLYVPFIYAVDDNIGIQDLGYTDSMDDIDVSPQQGFTFAFAEAIPGHTYAFLTLDGNYAKIRATEIEVDWAGDKIREAWMTFDWAYQLQPGNPELAPGRK